MVRNLHTLKGYSNCRKCAENNNRNKEGHTDMFAPLKNQKGFTLIELVIIIILIGVLAAIAVPRYVDMKENAVVAASQATLDAGRAGIMLDFANKVLGSGYTTDIFPSYTGADQVITAATDRNTLETMLQGGEPNYPPNGTYDESGVAFRWVQKEDGVYSASNPKAPVLDAVIDVTCATDFLTAANNDCWVSKL